MIDMIIVCREFKMSNPVFRLEFPFATVVIL